MLLLQFYTSIYFPIMQLVFTIIASILTKLPRPKDNKETFRTSSQTATCPPVYHTRQKLHTVFSNVKVKQESSEYQFLKSLV